MKTYLKEITPNLARVYLARNNANRPLRQVDVESYARDMVNGKWETTHQGIAFDREGNLVDGQHRLNAIIQSGVTVTMMVTENVPGYHNIDMMLKRTARDILGEDPSKVFLARFFIERRYGKISENFSKVKPTVSEIQKFIEMFKEPLEFVTHNMNSSKKIVTQVAIKAAVLSAYFYEDHERLAEFCEAVISGFSKSEDDSAAIRLREFLFSPYYASKALKGETYWKTIRAIQLFCKRKYIYKLGATISKDPYPKFIGLVKDEFLQK